MVECWHVTEVYGSFTGLGMRKLLDTAILYVVARWVPKVPGEERRRRLAEALFKRHSELGRYKIEVSKFEVNDSNIATVRTVLPDGSVIEHTKVLPDDYVPPDARPGAD